jgi:hypothetical protein
MRFLISASTAFASAFIAFALAMLISHWLGLAPFQLWVAVGVAAGCALAFGAKAQWQLPRGAGAALVGLLVGVGYAVGTWLSAHA